MPLRKWYAAQGVEHPTAYSMATLALGVVVCMALAVFISIRYGQEALERERASREDARRATCMVIGRMIDVYAEPTTPTGVNAQAAWRDLGVIFNCKGDGK